MPAASLLVSLVLSFRLFSTSALHVPFPSVTVSSPHETFIQHPAVPSNTLSFPLPLPWRIPNSSTSLQLRLGRRLHHDTLLYLLTLIQDEVEDMIVHYGGDAPLAKDGYDCDYEELEFSAYSPLERGHTRRMTWKLLWTIIEGLSVYLYDQMRDREAFFTVLDGPGDVFVGYGHLIQKRDGVAVV